MQGQNEIRMGKSAILEFCPRRDITSCYTSHQKLRTSPNAHVTSGLGNAIHEFADGLSGASLERLADASAVIKLLATDIGLKNLYVLEFVRRNS